MLPWIHAEKLSNRVRSPQEENVMGSCHQGPHKKEYCEEYQKRLPQIYAERLSIALRSLQEVEK